MAPLIVEALALIEPASSRSGVGDRSYSLLIVSTASRWLVVCTGRLLIVSLSRLVIPTCRLLIVSSTRISPVPTCSLTCVSTWVLLDGDVAVSLAGVLLDASLELSGLSELRWLLRCVIVLLDGRSLVVEVSTSHICWSYRQVGTTAHVVCSRRGRSSAHVIVTTAHV